MKLEEFAEKLWQAMKAENLTVEALLTKAPVGFWKRAEAFTGLKADSMQAKWYEYKPKISETLYVIIARERTVDKVDRNESEALEPVVVDIVDRAETGTPENAMVDKPDISETMREKATSVMVAKPDLPDREASNAVMVAKPDLPDREASNAVMVANNDRPEGEGEPAPVAKVDIVTRGEIERMLAEFETKLTTLIDQRIAEGISNSVTVAKVDTPPLPKKTGPAGKKFLGEKEDLRARVDANLFRLLEDEAVRDHSGNMSRALDCILWRYYGRPKLSFEAPETD